MPLLSVLVTPVCPTSWMEMAGLDVEEWMGRTGGETHTLRYYQQPPPRGRNACHVRIFYPHLPHVLTNSIRREPRLPWPVLGL